MSWITMILASLAGVTLGIQASINGGLGKKIGSIEGAFISFIIGTVVLFLLTVFFGKGNLLSAVTVPKWQLLGGVLGVIYMIIAVYTVPKIGVAAVMVSIISGQILTGMVIDNFGLFGGRQIPFDWQRLLAIVLFGVGLFLIYRK